MATVVTVANLKGGTAKTTTVAYLAHAWAQSGRAVIVVDADPQGSALRWSELGEWSIPTLALPVRDLHRRLAPLTGQADTVVIDTPPLDEAAGISYSALRAADVVIVPMAPTMAELDRLPDLLAALEEVEPLRENPARLYVLLNRAVARAASTEQIRQAIEDAGTRVLPTAIPRREAYAQAFGRPIEPDEPYQQAATEIDKESAS